MLNVGEYGGFKLANELPGEASGAITDSYCPTTA